MKPIFESYEKLLELYSSILYKSLLFNLLYISSSSRAFNFSLLSIDKFSNILSTKSELLIFSFIISSISFVNISLS